jgi:hypothetical protein
LFKINLYLSFLSSFLSNTLVPSEVFLYTSITQSTTVISVPLVLFLVTAKIVHLTAAVESVVCISNSLWSFRLVALVQIVPVSPYIGAVFGDGGGV